MGLFPVRRDRLVALVPPLLVALLGVPFVVHQNSWFEWANSLWLLQRETAHVGAHGTPTFFLHAADESFYPHYIFYAGPLLSALAYPAALIGPWPVFAAATIAGPVAGYLGIRWAARSLGVPDPLAVLPGLAFATTPYLLTALYGRGAWAEMLAVNAVAVLLGAVTALLWRPERSRVIPLSMLAISAAVIAGTHNLTLLMATIALPLIVAALLPLLPGAVRGLAAVRRLAWGVGAIALGVGLTGAWLIPNLWLAPNTFISNAGISKSLLDGAAVYARPGIALSPWPVVPHQSPGDPLVYAQAPSLAMLWAVIAVGVVVWGRRRTPDRVTLSAVALLVLGIFLTLLVLDASWWQHFPRLVQAVQFPFRTVPYVAMVTAIAMSAMLVALRGRRAARPLSIVLAGMIAVQIVCAAYIVLHTPASSVPDRPKLAADDVRSGITPPSFQGPGYVQPQQFRDLGHATITIPPGGPLLAAQLRDPSRDDVGTLRGTGTPGQIVPTSVVWSPLVRVDGGARIAGRDAAGYAVVAVTQTDSAGAWSATVQSSCTTCLSALKGGVPWQLLAGRLLTLISAVALAVFTALAAVALLRRGRRTAVLA